MMRVIKFSWLSMSPYLSMQYYFCDIPWQQESLFNPTLNLSAKKKNPTHDPTHTIKNTKFDCTFLLNGVN